MNPVRRVVPGFVLKEATAGIRVAVVGDVMLDRYWRGDVERISPESPVPVVDIRSTECRLGGAANVAANVASLGAACTLVSAVGEDEAGRALCDLLARTGIDSRVRRSESMTTIEKLRIVARNQQLLRVDFESRPTHEELARSLDDVREVIGAVDALILSDYGKGGLTHIARMIELARAAGVPVVVDPKGGDYSRYRGAAMITPNLREFEQAGGVIESEETLQSSAEELIRRFDLGGILVTRSEQGMTLFTDGQRIHGAALAREVFDVSGAGDTVVAVIGVGLAAGFGFEDILELANRAAGQVVGKFGTAVVDADALEEELAAEAST